MGRRLATLALLLVVAITGCAGVGTTLRDLLQAGPRWRAERLDDLSRRARALEAQGELRMAVDHWRVIEGIAAGADDARREIDRLHKRIADAVADHYAKGLEAWRRNRGVEARNHFLAALRLDPDFRPARRQIMARFGAFPLTLYRTVAGQRPADVARKIYGDRDSAYLVAWFNRLPEDQAIPAGTLLILPKPERRPTSKGASKRLPDPLAAARARLAVDDFDGALAAARRAGPDKPEVKALIQSIGIKRATAQIATGDLDAAAAGLAAIPDGAAGKAEALASLTAAREQQRHDRDVQAVEALLERHAYRQGLTLAETLIEAWPQDDHVRRLASEARYRLARDHVEHRRFLAARQVLTTASADHAASMDLKRKVERQLEKIAQRHYRNGVKHFINEDLEAAIREWQMALKCNPALQNVRDDIANARRLQKKVDTLP